MSPAGRLSGHIVQGHVDGTGEMILASSTRRTTTGGCKVRVPDELDRYLVYKGSVAIDGISLTVASIEERRAVGDDHSAHLREHDQSAHGRSREPGVRLFAKYVEKLVDRFCAQVTVEQLR